MKINTVFRKKFISVILTAVMIATLFSAGGAVFAEGTTMTANKTHIYAGETVKLTLANVPDGAEFACFPGRESGAIDNYNISGYQKLSSSTKSVSYKFTKSGYYVLAVWTSGWNWLVQIPIKVDAAPTVAVNTQSISAGGTFKFSFTGITDADTTFGLIPCNEDGYAASLSVAYGYFKPAAGTSSVSVTVPKEGYYRAALWGPGWDFVAQTVVAVGKEIETVGPEMTVDKTNIEAGETLHFTLSNLTSDVEFGLLYADSSGNIAEPKKIFSNSYKKLAAGTVSHSYTVTTAGTYVAAIWGSGWNFYEKIPITVNPLPDPAVHQTVYVDAENGNNSNAGTADAPKADLFAAINSISTTNGTVMITGEAVYSDAVTARGGTITLCGTSPDSAIVYGSEGITLKSNTAISALTLKSTADGIIRTNGYLLTTDSAVTSCGASAPVFCINHQNGNTTLLDSIGVSDVTIGKSLSGETAVAFNGKDGYKAVKIDQDGVQTQNDEHITVDDGLTSTEYKFDEYSKYINYRKPLNNIYKKLTVDKSARILYLGGSVTAGYGGNIGGWRGLSMGWFSANFPTANIKYINTAIGESGTFLGTYRIQTDVIDQKPDLLFIEYAINDTYKGSSKEQAALQYETIVREVKSALPDCDIVTLLVTDRNRYSSDGLYPTAAGHEEIASKYNISTVNVGACLVESMDNYLDDAEWYKYFLDGVHPLNAGYEVYFDCLQEYLRNTLLYTDYTKITSNRDVLLPVQSECLLDGNRISSFGADLDKIIAENNGFTYSEELFHSTGDTPHYGYYHASSTDAAITFKFSGTEFAFWTNFYNTSSVKYSIDGGEYVTINCDRHAPTQVITGLPSGNHTITVSPVTFGSESNGIFKIGAVFTRDETRQTAKGTVSPYSDGVSRVSFTVSDGTYMIKYTANTDGFTKDSITLKSTEMRATKKVGLRFVLCRSAEVDALIKDIGTDFTYGYLVLPCAYIQKGEALDLDSLNAVKGSSSDTGFKLLNNESDNTYSVCITGIKEARYTAEYAVRGYITYTDQSGATRVIYSDIFTSSLYAAAKNTDKTNLSAEQISRIDAVINSVYGQ